MSPNENQIKHTVFWIDICRLVILPGFIALSWSGWLNKCTTIVKKAISAAIAVL